MRYNWPDLGTRTQDLHGLRSEFNAFRDIHLPEGLYESLVADREAYLRVLRDLGRLTDANRWIPIGPSAMLNGHATGDPIVAGRIRDMKVHPSGTRAYAGTANGGVWYRVDDTWHPIGSWAMQPNPAGQSTGRVQSLTIGALDVHFGSNSDGTDNPDLDVVYAATGELRPVDKAYPSTKHGGIGVLRLADPVNTAIANPGNVPWVREGTSLNGAGIYRLTHDPANRLAGDATGANTMIAAASTGLYFRQGAFAANAAWTRVERSPFDFAADAKAYVSDVLWTPGASSRLFVALTGRGGPPTAVFKAQAGPDSDYDRIDLPGVRSSSRLRLAHAPSNPEVVYVLGTRVGKLARLWRIDGDGPARIVDNIPPLLFGRGTQNGGQITVTKDSSHYDMALAVDPGDPATVIVGGKAANSNAALFRLTVSGTAAADDFASDFDPANDMRSHRDATFIGSGVHADVHAIEPVSDGGLWIGCDGGAFVVETAGPPRQLNDGLAVSEPGYVASHPTNPGGVIAGTHDNGRIERVGDTIWRLWRKGDGGGTGYHQTNPAYYIGQYIRGEWRTNGGTFTRPVFRRRPRPNRAATASETKENKDSQFYSNVAITEGTGGNTRLAIGTNRVWFSPDWNPTGAANSWVTLPNGTTDPRQNFAAPNDAQDRLGPDEEVSVLKWAARGDPANNFDGARLLVLTTKNILQFSFDQSDNTWSRHNFTDEKDKNRIIDNGSINPGPADRLPRIGKWSDIAPHDARGRHGAFYVGATGKARLTATGQVDEADQMDTLWWFDGDNRWFSTNLRNQGLSTTEGTSGSKAPVFAVIVDPDKPEHVYVGNSSGVWRGTFSLTGATPSWHWEGLLNGLPQAVIQDLSIYHQGSVKLLRAALQSRGVWELDISDTPGSVGNTYLRTTDLDTRRVELPSEPIDPRDLNVPPERLELDDSPDIYLNPSLLPPPWISGLPSEAQLYQAVTEERDNGPSIVTPDTYETFVMAHHRDTARLDGSNVSLLLLLLEDAPEDLSAVAINAAWRRSVVDLLRGTSATAPAGWSLADPGTPVRTLTTPIEARTPRSVRFDADLSHPIAGGRDEDEVLLLAVVSSTRDTVTEQRLNQNTLSTLIRRSRHIAARRVFRESP